MGAGLGDVLDGWHIVGVKTEVLDLEFVSALVSCELNACQKG
jgi:hypothetical protein